MVNYVGLSFITKSKGSITSNVIKINHNFFSSIYFDESKSNTASGFCMKIDLYDFDLQYKVYYFQNTFNVIFIIFSKLLDIDSKFVIEFLFETEELKITYFL